MKWAILLILSAATPALAVNETLSNLISDARVLALDGSSPTRQIFTDAQVTEFLNQAQRNAIADDHCIQQSTIFQLQQGVTYYTLPSNYDAMFRVTVGNKWLQQMTPASLDGRSRGWETATGYPTYYFINFTSRSLVGFAPFPQAAADVDTVKIEYDVSANDLVNGTDLPFNGINELQQYNHILVYYAAAMMESTVGQMEKSQAFMSIYNAMVKVMENHCTEIPSYLPSATGSQ